MSQTTVAELRRRFDETTAPELARAVTAHDPTKLKPPRDVSSRFSYFATEKELIVAAGQQEEEDVDRALAYGLSLLKRWDFHALTLVVPQRYVRPTQLRLAWVDVPVTLIEYDGRRCRHAPPASIEEAIDAAQDPYPARDCYDLGLRQQFVRELIEWADRDERLSRDDRTGYAAWYHAGALILKIQKTGSRLRVTAGVNFSKPKLAQVPALEQIVEARLEQTALRNIQAAVERAIATYAGRPEARFQSFLYKNPQLVEAHAAGMQREVPVIRPRGRGFVDFVAKDASGEIRLIETKVGPDPMVVLQAVDYWAWGCAVRPALARKLGLESEAPLAIDIVAAANKKARTLDDHALPIAEALKPAVRLRIFEVHGWDASDAEARVTASRRTLRAAADPRSSRRH